MNVQNLMSVVVAVATVMLTMTALATDDPEKHGDCPTGKASAVIVACGNGPAAERAGARCGSGCCDQATLRQQARANCPGAARAKNFNSSRSNRGSVAPPNGDAAATQVDSERDGDGFEEDSSNERGRMGRNPQTGKEIKIPVDDDSDAGGVADAEEKTDDGIR